MWTEIITILILICINGLFSMSEIAVVSSRKSRLEIHARRGKVGAIRALSLANNPNRFLSTVQIGITLVSILTGIYGGASLSQPLEVKLQLIPAIAPYAHSAAVGIVVIAITFFSLVFGELIPKRIGMSMPEKIAETIAGPMMFLARVTSPFIWLLTSTTDLFTRVLGVTPDESKVTEEEIRAIIDEGATAGTIDEIEQDIVERVFHLGDKRVSSLMTPRPDIIWLDIHDQREVSLNRITEHRHSVFPLCEDSLDNVIGMVSVKDILPTQLRNEPLDLQKLVSPALYFPESMTAFNALDKFKESRVYQALIVDEYGTTVGMVTMNDLFDALVGDISQDDGSSIGYDLTQRDDGSWLVDGQYPWDDFLKDLDIEDEDLHDQEGFQTISGFILERMKVIPKVGDKVEHKTLLFEVMDMDGTRIDKILFVRVDEEKD